MIILINKILNLPARFKNSKNNNSIYSLLQGTGYFEAYDSINENSIREVLVKQSEYVYQWLRWSEDKRSSSGWYFIQNGNQKYVVGYLDSDKGITEKMDYSDIKIACAAYIKQEIESIRKS